MPSFDEAYDNYTKSAQGQAVSGMYDAQRDANLSRMEEEYNRNRSQQQADAAKIAGNYQTQKNDLNAQYERQRRNFNQQAAANGINTGTASQAGLATNAAYQRSFGQLGAAQAQDEATAARGLSDLESAYRSQVNAAIANSDYQRAAALMQGYQDDRQRQMNEAQLMAGYGIFDGYSDLYGQDTADTMRQLWIAQNPLLAYNTGAITAKEYFNMTGKYAPGKAPVAAYGGGGRKSSQSSGSDYNSGELLDAAAAGMNSSQIAAGLAARGVDVSNPAVQADIAWARSK